MAETDAPGATWAPSPNFGPRRHGGAPSLVVLHYTAMPDATAALDRLRDPEPPEGLGPVSAHYLVSERGDLWQLVREADRAWHAGAGNWAGCEDVNSHSIGIELANTGAHPFAERQMAALEALLSGIMARWSIGPQGVIAHSDMAPGRKTDPGPRFDWRRLARQGLALWPEGDATPGDFDADLAAIGYRAPEGCSDTLLLDAFRLRFRPWATGPLTDADRAAARSLAVRTA
ncbi:N-acetylmuramoyl-L-alanine amidase [Pseudooceanicola sp. LIPI14-2-Ac024]|uniref:N-acetylmuramoyl-L-alanine amidase n=1 Tax=Pseudooceanicola sp. LIPI14-2-Ac024 TaxID=3344875 RepID=UPI0035D02312